MSRRGVSLMELLVAVALAAGPLLVALHLIQTNVQAARFNQERATARLVLQDMVDLLMGEPMDTLRGLSGPGKQAELDDTLDARVAVLPEEARKPYADQARAFRGRLMLALEEDLGAEAPGLARMTLTAGLDRGTTVRLVRLFRPAARVPAGP